MIRLQEALRRLRNVLSGERVWGSTPADRLIGRQYLTSTLTIANGQTTSTAFDARCFAMFHLYMPTTFTGTSISFLTSADGVTYQECDDNTGTKATLTVAASKDYDLPTALAGAGYFKIVSNATEGQADSLVISAKG